MNFADAEKLAASILYEGYILYPYRPTAIKNRQRWNFGTLYPRVYAEAQHPQEPFRFIAECLVEALTEDPTLDVKIQFLQLIHQGDDSSTLNQDGARSLSDPSLAWDVAVKRKWEQEGMHLNDLIDHPLVLTMQTDASDLLDDQTRQTPQRLLGVLTIRVSLLASGARKVCLELQNSSPILTSTTVSRGEALQHSFVSAHVLLGINSGEFISLLDPPEIYRESATACMNVGVFPVLVGNEPDRSMMLCSPIILYDYPKIAPESTGDFFDGTEMDEMLTLRVLTLTDAEKQLMREGDPEARRILERAEALSAESLMKVHGVIRGMHEMREDTQ